ncbi:Phosphatidylserine decarboxylase proenzyme 2 [Nakaseomyces bracarensis]|uniref:Phosphatidylserine decarboxylase proenzyme 2 n=1 Tax=Nakaseomyces bracarensis TaxID=273131 RepID=A0ABR4NPA3_9SACH
MRIIGRNKKKNKDKLYGGLSLEVHLVGTHNVELFKRFQCSPTCFVTTNTFFVERSTRLRNSNSRWDQIIKLKLPSKPNSPWVNIIVYDCISSRYSHGVNDGGDPGAGDLVLQRRRSGSSILQNSKYMMTGAASNNTLPINNEDGYSTQHYNASTDSGLDFPFNSKASSSANLLSAEVSRNSRSLMNISIPKTNGSSPTHSPVNAVYQNSPGNHQNHRSNLSISRPNNNSNSNNNISGSGGRKGMMAKNRSSYLYVGEARVSLLEIFKVEDTTNKYNFYQKPRWLTLYDKKRQREENCGSDYVVGEVQVGFRLRCTSKNSTTIQVFSEWQKYLQDNLKSNDYIQNVYSATNYFKNPSEDIISMKDPEAHEFFDEFDDTNDDEPIEDEDDDGADDEDEVDSESLFAISDDLVNPMEMLGLSGNSHGDDDSISDALDVISFEGAENDGDPNEYDNDDESLTEVLKDLELVDELADPLDDITSNFSIPTVVTALDEYDVVFPNGPPVNIDDLMGPGQESPVTPTTDNFPKPEKTFFSSSNSSKSTQGDESDKDDSSDLNSTILKMSKKKRIPLLNRKRINRQASGLDYHGSLISNQFQLAKKEHALGVIFIHFQHIEDLPELKNKISKTYYAMDPFIVATYGRRVFKTSWRKHALNPIFDEYAAFEVYPNEKNFDFHFNVIDKDSFSYNDNIAKYDLTWPEIMAKQTPDHEWQQYKIPLNLTINSREDFPDPILTLGLRYVPYSSLKKFFWEKVVALTTNRETFDIVQTYLFLQTLGSFSESDANEFFELYDKRPWAGDTLTQHELVGGLEKWNKSADFKNIWKCPNCLRSFIPTNNEKNTKLTLENDLITHFALCTLQKCGKVLKPSYVSSEFASKRWFSKVLIKLTYGRYAVGSNNANILVQDRDSGIVLEEKISPHVKVGMRIIYNGKGKENKRFKTLLKTLSVRQGKKFDSPLSARQIDSFIKFHSLDMSQCMEAEYKTFNEFFYRKLKPGSRMPEGDSPQVMVCPADSRCAVYSSIHKSKEIWIKGSKFTLARLTKSYRPDLFNESSSSIAIFRLAPQDYHRIHCPVDGIIGKPIYVDGEYYTVNPMAVRSELDVFGENIRIIIPIESPQFGTLLYIPVGAMMVGSIILTCKEGDTKKRGDEIGYFKFGGSTVIIIAQSDKLIFDSDLVHNSLEGIETLVKVGMSLAHTPKMKEFKRRVRKPVSPDQIDKIKKRISVTMDNMAKSSNIHWQAKALTDALTSQ